ncbi:hypothetical protein M0802_016888 [Mischocyttarus mexicanus]|nr:hypothetical protein M0802_016888 [Mischocyttarus mexicanus]
MQRLRVGRERIGSLGPCVTECHPWFPMLIYILASSRAELRSELSDKGNAASPDDDDEDDYDEDDDDDFVLPSKRP